jgi:6-phosphogluconolactonase
MTVVHTLADNEAACAFAAQEMAAGIRRAIAARGVAHVSLAGGGTPRRAYELLAPLLTDWSAVELWYGDERCVDAEDPDSNHLMVAQSLLAAIAAAGAGAPIEHRIVGELGAEAATAAYEALLHERIPLGDDGLPALDVSLLGLGEDGHTASLFPGHAEVTASHGLCLPVHNSPKPPPDRVTLTVPMLRAARTTLLLATGAGKQVPLAAVLVGPDPATPASLLGGDRFQVVTDEAAHPAAA